MNRREKLLLNILGKDWDKSKERMLDTTIKVILGDMGSQYFKFWDSLGPGVLCFQPEQDNSVFYMTLKELDAASKQCEEEGNKDLAETFQKILTAANKIDPEEKAGYVINDTNGIRYLEIAYSEATDQKVSL